MTIQDTRLGRPVRILKAAIPQIICTNCFQFTSSTGSCAKIINLVLRMQNLQSRHCSGGWGGAKSVGCRANTLLHLTFIGPCIANTFAEYNQQDDTFLNLFISVGRSTCFRRVFSVRHQELKTAHTASGIGSDQYQQLPVFSSAMIVVRTRLNVTLYVLGLSCYSIAKTAVVGSFSINQQILTQLNFHE